MNSIDLNAENRYIRANTLANQRMNHIKDIIDDMTMIANRKPDQCTSKLEAALPHLKAAIEALGCTDELDPSLAELDAALAELDAALELDGGAAGAAPLFGPVLQACGLSPAIPDEGNPSDQPPTPC